MPGGGGGGGPDEDVEDMAANGLALRHLVMALDVVLLVAAMEVSDGVIIAHDLWVGTCD